MLGIEARVLCMLSKHYVTRTEARTWVHAKLVQCR